MTAKQALKIAMSDSHFAQIYARMHDDLLMADTCICFSIGDESFYIADNGYTDSENNFEYVHEFVLGKHSAKRALWLINRGETYVIRVNN